MDIALDIVGDKIYWTDIATDKIQRANLDGAGVEDLLSGIHAFGIALDVTGGKMYWTSIQGKIERANLDGSVVETVLDNGLGQPTGIALDLRRSIPTLSEWGLIAMLGLFLAMGTLIIRRRGSVGRDADSDDTANVLPKADAQAVRDSINRLWTD